MGKQGEPVSEAELQQDLQRFTGQFIDLMAQGGEQFAKIDDPKQHEIAMRRVLVYASSSLDIATGPLAQMNLLDMIVFVELSRDVLQRYWIPEVLQERGRGLLDAFDTARDNIWTIAAKVMTREQQEQLRQLIRDWQKEHPGRIPVENVRLTDFSIVAGRVETERSQAVGGLFGSLKSATSAADRGTLLAERAMFLSHRLPFLLRLQTRLGAQEIVDDSVSRLGALDTLMERTKEMQPLARELSQLLVKSEAATREARDLVQSLEPLIAYTTAPSGGEQGKRGPSLEHTLDASNRLVDKTLTLVDRAEKLTASSKQSLAQIDGQVDRMMRRMAFYLILVGAVWALLFFWAGHFLIKRHAAATSAKPAVVVAPQSAPEPHRMRTLRARPSAMITRVAPHSRRQARRSKPEVRDRGADTSA